MNKTFSILPIPRSPHDAILSINFHLEDDATQLPAQAALSQDVLAALPGHSPAGASLLAQSSIGVNADVASAWTAENTAVFSHGGERGCCIDKVRLYICHLGAADYRNSAYLCGLPLMSVEGFCTTKRGVQIAIFLERKNWKM